MPHRNLVYVITLIAALIISGCVSIPEQVQLLHRQTFQDQAPASCRDDGVSYVNIANKKRPELDTRRISLLNWNIYKGQKQGWKDELQRLLAASDIAVIQEAVMRPSMNEVLNTSRLDWSLNTAFYYDKYEAGVMTASRVPALRSCGLRATEPLIRIPKTALVSEYPLSNTSETLLVANIHSINFTLGTDAYAKQINTLMDAVRNHTGPMIIAGDFNTWSDSRMDIVINMANNLSLKSVEYKSHNRITILGNPLDHVFYRGLEVIEELTLDVETSDHNPIQVTFAVPEQPQSLLVDNNQISN